MKRVIGILMSAVFIFSLSSCGKKSENTDVKREPVTSTTTETTTRKMSIDFPESEIIKMSNYMNDGQTAVSGTWLYGVSFNENGNGTLTKIKSDGSEQKRMSSKFPAYINVAGGWLYYIGCSSSEDAYTVSKIRLSGEDEKALATIKEKSKYFAALTAYNDKLYFTELDETNPSDIKGKYYCMDMDGKNKKVIIDRAVYYPYIINDKIYYQDDSDYCRIHVCDIDGTNDRVFINEWVYQFIFDGTYFYYATYEDKNLKEPDIRKDIQNGFKIKKIVKRCDIEGKNDKILIDYTDVSEIAMNKNTLFYTDKKDDLRLYSYKLSDGTVDLISNDNNVVQVSILNNQLSYYDIDDNRKYVDHIYYCNLDGTNKSEIFKNANQ